MSMDMKSLRKTLRQQRRRVSVFEHKKTEQRVLTQLGQSPIFKQAQHIGVYLHAFGEVHTHRIIMHSFALGKKVYLPMICNMNQTLHWVRITQQQYLNKRFSQHPLGMKEPMQSRGKDAKQLDLLIMPLLACDAWGTRIGMGGGYYDRTLATAAIKPIRMGLAHDFQYLETRLDRQLWDQPLDGLITPSKSYRFKRNLRKNSV